MLWLAHVLSTVVLNFSSGKSRIQPFLARPKNELMQWSGVRRLSVCKLLRKSLLLAGKWPDRHQTCTRWSPGKPASRVCSRSRSKVTWYALFFGFFEWATPSLTVWLGNPAKSSSGQIPSRICWMPVQPGNYKVLLMPFVSIIYSVSPKKSPPEDLWQYFQNGWEFFNQILHAYYVFLSTPDYKQISATVTKLCHIKRDHPVKIMCAKCPPSAKTHFLTFFPNSPEFLV